MAAAEPGRPELEAAIAALNAALATSAGDPPRGGRLELLVRGRSALDATPTAVAAALEPLLAVASSATPTVPAASTAPPPEPGGAAPDPACATLALLLEAGTPLDREISLRARTLPVRELLQLALQRLGAGRAEAEPWALDLLAFAVLAGESERRDELARATHAALTRLELDRRGTAAADGLGLRDFQLDAAVFRAVAVLAEPDLKQRALLQLNALLQAERRGREARRRALAQAADETARRRQLLAEAEALGQLEVALFGAHLALRRHDRPGPAAPLASSMRQIARQLVAHAAPLAAALSAASGSDERLHSAAHALRGLRAARVAL